MKFSSAPDQARTILLFSLDWNEHAPGPLTDLDVAFAQTLFGGVIDESYLMRYVEGIFDVFHGKPPSLVSRCKGQDQRFHGGSGQALGSPMRVATTSPIREFYANARVTVAVKFRSQWALRVQSGEKLDYESKLARQPDRFRN